MCDRASHSLERWDFSQGVAILLTIEGSREINMGDARYTKDGLLIPTKFLRGFGGKVRVQRNANVLIIESSGREAARKQLERMVRALRGSAVKRGGPKSSEIEKLVRDVRKIRAGRVIPTYWYQV